MVTTLTTLTTLTTRIPRTWVIPTPDDSENNKTVERTTLRLLTFLLFCEIFLQRIAVPVGSSQVALTLPVLFIVLAVLLARGDVWTNIARTRAYLIAMAACCAAAFLAFGRGEPNASITSLLLLTATYLPFCFGFTRKHRTALFPRILDRFVLMTSVLAGLALLQFALQLAGWKYDDVIAHIVPPDLLLQNFNTSYPVQYGSSLYKSNAFIALEPSFASQFLALGLVVSILRGRPWWHIPIFVLAILVTVSGTGVVLLAIALILLSVHKGLRFTATALVGVALVIMVVSITPAWEIFAARATETSSSSSSGNLRFIQPYTRMYEFMSTDPLTALAGNGPGWADRDANQFFDDTGLPLLYAFLPKLLLEYGLVAGITFLTFLIAAFVRGSPSFVLSGTVLIFYILLSSNLLNPTIAFMGLLLLAWFTEDRHPLAVRTKPVHTTVTAPTKKRHPLAV